MTWRISRQVRAGNKALSNLIAQCSPTDAKLQRLIDSLPNFATELYGAAQDEARKLLRSGASNTFARIIRAIGVALSGSNTQEAALANSTFDLHLTTFLAELMEYLNDNTVASTFVDALLYEATGFESGVVTDERVLFYGTYNTRGIQKFEHGRRLMPHIKDIEGWMFGSEYSAIVCGSPKDITKVFPAAFFSVASRARAYFHIRYLLYDRLPTKAEEQAAEAWLREGTQVVEEMIKGIRTKVQK
jgi:hypothetical protein